MLVLALTCACLTSPGQADEAVPHPPFEADYRVYRAGFPVGEAHLELAYEDATRYRMRSTLRMTGLASLISTENVDEEVEGELIEGRPRPRHYRMQKVSGESSSVSLDFEWDLDQVTTRVNGKKSSVILQPRTVDPLSLILLTMVDLRSGRLAGEYGVVDGDGLKTYHVELAEQSATATPIGRLKTLAVTRKRPNSRKATTFWHAPELQFLPVQISRTKDGSETARLIIQRLTR